MLQVFVWTGGSFTLLQTLDFEQDIVSVALFSRAQVPYLLVCTDRQTGSCLLLQWTGGRFQNPQPLKLPGRAIRAEAVNTRAGDTLLMLLIEGDQTCFNITLSYCLLFSCMFKYPLRCVFVFER